ncbi:ATP-binding protein [Glutamicibacter ardleyensis]|uniref:ATP-binding protein n=1 Tax=Glutamicibacter ardleyensis TaxID=225894 RepID=UPI003FD4BA5C
MNQMLTSEDHQKIKDLRLTVFAEKFFELTHDESNDRLLPEEVFMNAVDHTLGIRQSQKTSKLIKQAQFPLPSANIAELHYLPGRNIDQARMKRYANHEWRTDPTNLLIISPTGGGKTYIACAIGVAACHSGHSVYYTRMDDLARLLMMASEDRREHHQLLERLQETDLLIIDDFLTVGIDQNIASDLFAVLADREHRLPTVIVSQTDPSYWVKVLPDKVAGDSIVNRLANNTRWLLLGKTDMRQINGEKARDAADFWE